MKKLEDIPFCAKCGIIFFPVLILSGVFLSIFTSGRISYLFWAYLPVNILGKISPSAAENRIAIGAFLVALWFFIGAVSGITCAKLKNTSCFSKDKQKKK